MSKRKIDADPFGIGLEDRSAEAMFNARIRLLEAERDRLREALKKAMDEISPYEWMAREFDRLAVLRKMWSAGEVAAILRRYDIERATLKGDTP